MRVSTKLSMEEMQEGLRLARGKLGRASRFFDYLWHEFFLAAALLDAIMAFTHGLKGTGVLYGLFVMGLGIWLYFRLSRESSKTLSKINSKEGAVQVEEGGLREQRANGDENFFAWRDIKRWVEGEGVFVIRLKKTVLLLGKAEMSGAEQQTLRSVLKANVR